MFTKILLAVDGSREAQKAIDWAKKAVEVNPEVELTVLYVFQPHIVADPYIYTPLSIAYKQENIEEWIKSQEAIAEHCWTQFPKREQITYKAIQRVGNAATVICQEAEEGGYEVIVLGSKGHGLVSSVLVGSVSSKVLHQASCSVLIIK